MIKNRPVFIAIVTVILFALLLAVLPSVMYVVDQRELAVVLQFGEPVAERIESGVYFKIPMVQEVKRLPRTRQFWQGAALPDLPTKDDKKIEVTPWAIWRVTDPKVFMQQLRTTKNAEQRVAEFVRGAIRDSITQYDLAELVRSTSRELKSTADQAGAALPTDGVGTENQPPDALSLNNQTKVKVNIEHGRKKILDEIKKKAQELLASGTGQGNGNRGIELIDIGISQIEFVESVRIKTFDRWVAERKAISARNTNEGERLKAEIVNKAQAEVQRIEGEGQKMANETKGKVDAEVITKYAAAIEEAGEFYTFVRTLEAYKTAINKDTRLILTTDSDFLRLLKQLEPATPASSPTTP